MTNRGQFFVLLTLGAILMTSPVIGQDYEANVRHFTVHEAVEQALNDNHQYRSVINSVALAELDYEQARAEFKPRVYSSLNSDARTGAQVGSTYQVGMAKKMKRGSEIDFGFRSSSFGDDALSELRLSYSLPFFKNPTTTGEFSLDRAEIDLRHRQRFAKVGAEELMVQVISAYYQLGLAIRQIDVAKGEYAISRKLALATRMRMKTGKSSALDLKWAQLRVDQAEHRIANADLQKDRAASELKLMLGLSLDDQIEVDTELPSVELADDRFTSLEEAEALALRNRAELIALADDMNVARRKLRAKTNRFMPQVDVRLQYSLVGEGDAFDDSLSLNDSRFGVGVSVDMNGGRSANLEARRLSLYFDDKRNAYERLEGEIRSSVQTAVFTQQEQAGLLNIASNTLILARQQFGFVELKYRGGTATTQEVLEAQQALADAQYRELSARVNYLLANFRLKLATGTLLDEWLMEQGDAAS